MGASESPSRIEATGSVTIEGMGAAHDGALFGQVEKDAIYVARTNAIIDAIQQSIETESDEVRRLFKEGWGKVEGSDRRGADDFIEKQIVSESSASKYDLDKKTRKVTYIFKGKFDKARLFNVLGLTGKSSWKPMVFGLLRETTKESDTVLDEVTSSDRKRLQEAEGKLSSDDSGTAKEEVSQIKEQIRKTIERVSSEKKLTFGMTDAGIREAFSNQIQSTFESLGFDELNDANLLDEYQALAKEHAENPTGHTAASLRKALSVAGELGVDYVGVLIIDFSKSKKVGLGSLDSCTATVTGRILKKPAKGPLWSIIGNIDTKIVSKTGESEQDAKRKVAQQAAADAAVDMVAKIKNKGKL